MSWPTSVSGTSVWTGRALQAENDDLEMIGLAHLYPFVFLAIMDIRARSISFVSRPEGHMCHLITNALARPFLHLLIPTRRPRRESQLWLSGSARAVPSEPPSLARPIWRATGATGGGGHPRNRLHDQHPRPPASFQSRQRNRPIDRGSILGSGAFLVQLRLFCAD
jgi:hypothetical protein